MRASGSYDQESSWAKHHAVTVRQEAKCLGSLLLCKISASLTTLHHLDRFVRCQDRVCEKRIVNERRRIAITPFRVFWPRSSVFCDGYLEALFQQFPQMRFDAHVGQHTAKNDLADLPLTQL